LGLGSGSARDSRKENVPGRNANADCDRRRASWRCVSFAQGRNAVGAIVVAAGTSLPGEYSFSPSPMDAPLRSWGACPCQPRSPDGNPNPADLLRECVMKVARSSTLGDGDVWSGIVTGDSYAKFVSVVVRPRRTESGAKGSVGSGSG